MSWDVVIGLEVHAQLATRSKLFCACSTEFGAPPNAHTCEVCLGMPGVLPVPNARAVELAVRAGLALGCEIQLTSEWSRKNYFYPDLPKGYQVTQFARPYALKGGVDMQSPGELPRIPLTRIHIEEDAGKSVHDEGGGRSYVDLNRAGTPLIEIVSEPALKTAAGAAAYLRALRGILRALDVCDGNMQEGSLRCDANVSLRASPDAPLGTRTELKNLNSFRFLEQAITYEIERQAQVLEAGERVVQETRLWDTAKGITRSMRSKEEAHDYRYFPEPDLPLLVLEPAWIERIEQGLPELPSQTFARLQAAGLTADDAAVIIEEPERVRFFDAAAREHPNPKAIANWLINELLRELKDRALHEAPITPAALAELVALIDDGTISGKIAKDVFAELMRDGGSPKAIVQAKGLTQVSDAASVEPAVLEVISENPDSAQQYREGKTKVMGFLVGQVMKKTGGKANPKLVNELLRKHLES